MDIEDYLHIAVDITSKPADVEHVDTYTDNIHRYKNNNYTYIPMPIDQKYYDTDEGWVRDMFPEQIIREDDHIMDVLRGLQKYPFLLVDYDYATYIVKDNEFVSREFILRSDSIDMQGIDMNSDEITDDMRFTSWELESEHPDLADENLHYPYDERYGIITLADLNKRPVKEMIYPVIAQLENQLANKVQNRYPESEQLFESLRAETIGRWHKDRMRGLELHISEHMNLVEIKSVIQQSNSEFITECGFPSKIRWISNLAALMSYETV